MKKIILSALAASLFSFSAAYADVADYGVRLDDGTCTVSGHADESSANIALEIIEDAYTFNSGGAADVNLSNYKTAAVYFDQLDLDGDDKSFSFSVPIDGESRKLKARLNGTGFTEAEEFTMSYIRQEDFAAALGELMKNMADLNTFRTFMAVSDNAFRLMCDELPEDAAEEDVHKVMYASLKARSDKLGKMTANDMKKLWDKSALIALVNGKKVSDISKYKDRLDLTNIGSGGLAEKWYNKVAASDNSIGKLSNLLGMKTYSDADEFDTALRQALVLTVVKYPDGISNIGKIMSDFSDITGITSSGETEKYKTVAGKDFTDFDSYIKYFKALPSGSGSSGGSGSGGSGGSGGGGFVSGGTAGETAPKPQVNMRFIDLDTVPWAYEAISTLSDMGIINGREETKFAPDDTITREEFAKICVSVLSLDVTDEQCVFTDAKSGEWYSGYLNAAYRHGIIKGKGDGSFGVGEEISRQDAAVILYNLLIHRGFSAEGDGIDFADSDLISDYAKEAVSALSGCGVINGVGENRFDPLGNSTRAEAAKMVFGILEYIK